MSQNLFGGTDRSRLDRIAEGLRVVHRALIDATRLDYERTHGPVQGPYALFALVAHDPAFAWLQPMTALIVEIEDALGRKEPPIAAPEVAQTREKIDRLLASEGQPFSVRYLALVQSSAVVSANHTRLQALLRA